jgi:Tol biopolymer transport system component
MAQRFDNEDFRAPTMKIPEASRARRVPATSRTSMVARLVVLSAAAATLGTACGEARLDSGPIVFARAPATNAFSNLCLVDTDGSIRRVVHGGIANTPVWSPDGSRIAFQRAHEGESSSLYVANADGSDERFVPGGVSGTVDWSPDSRRLAVVDGGRIFVTTGDLRARAVLVDARPEHASDPRWSPDGTRVVFALGRDGAHADVYVVNADGTGRKRLTRLPRGAGFPDSPVWSPDGRKIAFVLPGSLQVMNADGSERRVLTRFPNGIFPSSPAWSPDGHTIAFARLKLGRDRKGSGLYVVDVDRGDVHRLTREIDSSPSWSPDGRRIAFQRLTGFHISEITVMDRDGSNQHSLTSGGWSDATPSWRPAG